MNCFTCKTNCFARKTLVSANQVRIHLLRVKQKYYYILMYCFTRKTNCFTRKTLVGANLVRIHILGVKQIVLRLKPIVLRVNHLFYA